MREVLQDPSGERLAVRGEPGEHLGRESLVVPGELIAIALGLPLEPACPRSPLRLHDPDDLVQGLAGDRHVIPPPELDRRRRVRDRVPAEVLVRGAGGARELLGHGMPPGQSQTGLAVHRVDPLLDTSRPQLPCRVSQMRRARDDTPPAVVVDHGFEGGGRDVVEVRAQVFLGRLPLVMVGDVAGTVVGGPTGEHPRLRDQVPGHDRFPDLLPGSSLQLLLEPLVRGPVVDGLPRLGAIPESAALPVRGCLGPVGLAALLAACLCALRLRSRFPFPLGGLVECTGLLGEADEGPAQAVETGPVQSGRGKRLVGGRVAGEPVRRTADPPDQVGIGSGGPCLGVVRDEEPAGLPLAHAFADACVLVHALR
ncbi:hypothetical protein [Embleya sp. NPDC020630]|uniref:hypothetical protein n=1 Tax=Embleya sp. NPDC020630 TaxID=3363979 RepID=UPI0037B4B8E9